jgi:membrane-associated phospholipid phosphatase
MDQRRVLWVVAAVALAVFAVLAVMVWHVHGPVGLDTAVGGLRRRTATQLRRAAYLGSPAFVFTVVLVLAVVAFARRDALGVALCIVGPALAGIGELVAKPIVHRLQHSALSYPSGHATLSAALAALIVVLAYRLGGARAAAVAAGPAAVLPVVASLAVVRLGWHYPTDAIGGAALGIGAVCATAAVLAAASVPPNSQKSDELVKAD